MKKNFRIVTAIIALAGICLSLCSCSVFATMRENALKASQMEIIPTPEDKALYTTFNNAIKNSVETAHRINTSVNYGVSDVKVTAGEEKAGLLHKASSTLAKMILANKPGHQSNEISPPSYAGTLLDNFDSASCLSYTVKRNIAKESLKDEKGKELTDENGVVLKHDVTKDNYAKVTLNFYNDVVIEEAYTNENGEDVAAVTERNFANDALIEKVFGTAADKAEVLSQFETMKGYIEIIDYTVTYDTCEVFGEIDLTTETLLEAKFTKGMLVTANVKGVGAFAEYGDMTVTFKLNKTEDYGFSYLDSEE